jgi:chaperonin GroEL
MAKNLSYNKEARKKLLAGVDKLAKTVGITMGPQGRNVILQKFIGNPVITKDGVSVAREIVLEDPIENLACQLVKEAAGRTADIAGDGTTTATVLTHEILTRGNTLIESNYNPLYLKRGLEWARDKIIDNLNSISTPINSINSLKNIATISSNNDPDMGGLIAEAFDLVGFTGTVTAEASPGAASYVRVTDGIEYKKGYITSNFITDGGSDIVLQNAAIILTTSELTSLSAGWISILNKLSESQTPVLIICKSLKQEALATLVTNNKLGRLKCVATEIPHYIRNSSEWLDDLSILLGTKIVGPDSGIDAGELNTKDLGFAKKVIVGKYETKILESKKDLSRLEQKINIYKEDLLKLLGDTDRLDVKKRLEFLHNKAAVIVVGYSTELELREKGDRLDDALGATRAAIDEGFVPGGGMALFKAANMVDISKAPLEIRDAASILIESCSRPLRQIAINAFQNPDLIVKEALNYIDSDIGFNAANCKWEDLVLAGVIDPKKVTRTALENSTSIALLIINTEAVVSDQPNNPSDWQPPAGWRPPESSNLNHNY